MKSKKTVLTLDRNDDGFSAAETASLRVSASHTALNTGWKKYALLDICASAPHGTTRVPQ